MNLDRKFKIVWISIIGCLILLICVAVFSGGCSKSKAATVDEGLDAKAASATGVEEMVFSPVKDSILESIRNTYVAKGIEVESMELAEGNVDCVKVSLAFPERTKEQTVLAGFRILRDSFPKLEQYIVKVGGKEYKSEWNVLSYIASRGWTIDLSEEDAVSYMEIVSNGIPEEDAGKPIKAEAV